MAALINLVGPFVVLSGLGVMLFGRGRAIEAYLAGLAAVGLAIVWAAIVSPYAPTAGDGHAFGFGLLVIGGTALLLHRVVVPAAEE